METDLTEQFKLHAAIQAVSLLDSGMAQSKKPQEELV